MICRTLQEACSQDPYASKQQTGFQPNELETHHSIMQQREWYALPTTSMCTSISGSSTAVALPKGCTFIPRFVLLGQLTDGNCSCRIEEATSSASCAVSSDNTMDTITYALQLLKSDNNNPEQTATEPNISAEPAPAAAVLGAQGDRLRCPPAPMRPKPPVMLVHAGELLQCRV